MKNKIFEHIDGNKFELVKEIGTGDIAVWIKSNGETKDVIPKNKKDFSLDEMYEYTNGGPIQIVNSKDGKFIVLNEEGKLTGLPLNKKATNLYEYGHQDPIVGDVLVCNRNQIE